MGKVRDETTAEMHSDLLAASEEPFPAAAAKVISRLGWKTRGTIRSRAVFLIC